MSFVDTTGTSTQTAARAARQPGVRRRTLAQRVAEHPDELDRVADRVDRQLIRIDTNCKPSRRGDHPVDLTHSDAVRRAVALLRATDDTFHYVQRGRLRPTEAAELLRELGELDYALAELRGHALGDLLHDSTMNSGPPAVR